MRFAMADDTLCPENMFSLEGKVALVTGASRGIGKAVATLLANSGATVILVSRKQESVDAVAKELSDAGRKAEGWACHMGDPEQIEQLIDKVKTNHKRLDILVNNAATNPYFGELLDADLKAWDKTFSVNLRGNFVLTQKAALLMKSNEGGSIINVSSINACSPPPLQGIYSITKNGLIAMTKTWAKELAPHKIRVNDLLPGLTDTKFASTLIDNEKILTETLKRIPLNRVALPKEMAGAVLFLASEASSYVTGTQLIVDGGFLS